MPVKLKLGSKDELLKRKFPENTKATLKEKNNNDLQL